MGAIKPLVAIDGKPMVRHVLDTLASAGVPALVVTGAYHQSIRAEVADVLVTHAADHALGMAHTLRAGLDAAPRNWAGVLVLLADMPLVQAGTLMALAAGLRCGARAVVPVHGGQRGNPAGFLRAAFPALLALEGDRGARAILNTLGVVEISLDDPGILKDFDRPEDLPR